MAALEASIEVDASPEAVWATVAEIPGWARWHPSVAACEPLTPGPVAPGSRYAETSTWGGREHQLEITVRRFDPPTCLITGTFPAPEYDAQGTWLIDALPNGQAKVTRRVEAFGPEGERRFPDQSAALLEQSRTALQALKQYLERA